MKHIGTKLFTGLLCMALLTVGLLWLIQAVFLKDSYLNERINTINAALENASGEGDYAEMESALNISVMAADSSGNITYMSQGMPMRGMMMRQMPDELAKSLGGNIQYMNIMHGARYAVLGRSLPEGGALYAVFSMVDVEEASGILLRQLWIISAAMLVFSAVIAFVLSRMFSRPVSEVTKAARAMAEGRYDIALPITSKDETGQLTAALNDLGAELRKTEDLRRELIANVSHELRSPLSVIQGFAETVRDITWPDEQKRAAQLTAISDEASRLSSIVGDILDYSRLQSGVDEPQITDFELCPLLGEVMERYSIEAAKRGLTLKTSCPENAAVSFDTARFKQVLYNLVSNAINHAYENTNVIIEAESLKSSMRISVKNSGDAIPEQDLEHIWDRYYRSQNISGRPLGTGLGLSIVKSILVSHGVRYGAYGRDGETVFWFDTLPPGR